MGATFTISLIGPLCMRAPDGTDITPRGTKAQGLIALLAEHDARRRSRRWIEARLWSDRAPAQASGSLRQTLIEIRRAFGDHHDLLGSDRLAVWLDPARVTVDLDDAPASGQREILEGLDVRDPEFEDWLRFLRQRQQTVAPSAPRAVAPEREIRLTCVTSDTLVGPDALIGRIIADQVGRNIGERVSSQQVAPNQPIPDSDEPPVADIEIQCDVSREAGGGVVFLQITHCRDRRVLFSGLRRPEPGGDLLAEDFVSTLAHEAALRTLTQLPQAVGLGVAQAAATGFCNLALRKLWTFDAAKVDEAELLMRKAFETDGNGVYLAWIAFIRMARVIERNQRPDPGFLEDVDGLMRHALELAPHNGMARALIALTRTLLFNDLETGVRMASDALRLNSGNLFARQALAVAGVTQGDTPQAHQLSSFCRMAVGADQGWHLWELYHAVVCIADHRFDEATIAAQRAVAQCPDFVAPRRLLVALHAARGNFSAAETQLAALARLEPGFSLDAYLRDDRYPVDTLRRANLLRHAASILTG